MLFENLYMYTNITLTTNVINLKATRGGPNGPPFNLNDENIPNADFFFVFKIYTFFL